MKVSAVITLLGKVKKTWTDSNNVERLSYKGNIMQDNGEIIDTISLTEEQFNTLATGKVYNVSANYGTGSNGGYLKITSITENK